jgi:5-(carboxyamino)imidazole ribonucleotide mutase
MQAAFDQLNAFSISFEAKITSAHRTPAQTHEYVMDAQARGCVVFIAAAGMAAHLAGAVAAITTRPVIGVPMESGGLGGMDALLSTVQMPGGIPVATVAVGKAGAKNAAYLAAQILGVGDATMAARVADERGAQADAVLAKDAALAKTLKS